MKKGGKGKIGQEKNSDPYFYPKIEPIFERDV